MANYKFPRTNIATTDPTSNNDLTQGYSEGVRWFNKTSGIEFICQSAAIGNAVWITQPQVSTDGSITKLSNRILLDGDEGSPDPNEYYGTDASGNKGWISVANLVEEQIAAIQASQDIYRRLLDSSPFQKCYFNAFGSDETTTLFTTAAGGDYPTYNIEDYNYTVQAGSVIQTEDIIVNGASTRQFATYVETDVEYLLEYSTNGFSYSSVSGNNVITDLGGFTSSLYFKITFNSTGPVNSFGIIYEGEQGVLYEFIESSNNIRYIEDIISVPSSGSTITAGIGITQGDLTGTYRQRYDTFYRQGLLLSQAPAADYEKDSYTEYSMRSGVTLNTGERVSFEKYLDLDDAEIYFVETNTDIGLGQSIVSINPTEFPYTPGNSEVLVWVSGVLQNPSSITEATNAITLGGVIESSDSVTIRKWVDASGNNITYTGYELNASEGQTTIALPFSYTAANSDTPAPSAEDKGYLMMFRNGIRMYRGQVVNEYDYRESDPANGTVTMNTSGGLTAGDLIVAIKLNYQ